MSLQVCLPVQLAHGGYVSAEIAKGQKKMSRGEAAQVGQGGINGGSNSQRMLTRGLIGRPHYAQAAPNKRLTDTGYSKKKWICRIFLCCRARIRGFQRISGNWEPAECSKSTCGIWIRRPIGPNLSALFLHEPARSRLPVRRYSPRAPLPRVLPDS